MDVRRAFNSFIFFSYIQQNNFPSTIETSTVSTIYNGFVKIQ